MPGYITADYVKINLQLLGNCGGSSIILTYNNIPFDDYMPIYLIYFLNSKCFKLTIQGLYIT